MNARTVKLMMWFGILFNAGLIAWALYEHRWFTAFTQSPALALCVWAAQRFYRRMKELHEDH